MIGQPLKECTSAKRQLVPHRLLLDVELRKIRSSNGATFEVEEHFVQLHHTSTLYSSLANNLTYLFDVAAFIDLVTFSVSRSESQV